MSFNVQVSTLKKFEGAYAVAPQSGLFAGVASGADFFSARWAPDVAGSPTTNKRHFFVLQRFRAKWRDIHDPTATQEIGLGLFIARSFTVADNAGTGAAAVDFTASSGNVGKKRTSMPTSAFGAANMWMGGSAAISGGTRTVDAQPIKADAFSALADAATVQKGTMELFLSQEDLDRVPVVLAPNEGLVLRCLQTMGAALTARLIVEMDWLEVERY